jgi:hypothetical protein
LSFIGQPAVHFSPTIAALTGASSRGLAQLSVTDSEPWVGISLPLLLTTESDSGAGATTAETLDVQSSRGEGCRVRRDDADCRELLRHLAPLGTGPSAAADLRRRAMSMVFASFRLVDNCLALTVENAFKREHWVLRTLVE